MASKIIEIDEIFSSADDKPMPLTPRKQLDKLHSMPLYRLLKEGFSEKEVAKEQERRTQARQNEEDKIFQEMEKIPSYKCTEGCNVIWSNWHS